MTQVVPTIPLITAVVRSDATGELTVDGETEAIRADESGMVSEEILNRVTALAGALGRPVRLTTNDDQGSWPLIVHPDGEVKSGGEPLLKPVPEPRSAPAPRPEWGSPLSTAPIPVSDVAADSPERIEEFMLGADAALPQTAPSTPVAVPPSRRGSRVSFVDEETRPKPASRGWRGLIAKSGIRIPPSARELAERSDIHAVSQHWPGPRTIAVVNGKGGANKTPTTAMLSAVFARNGGAGVLAWDNNETRGTLGWRTEQGLHAATVQTLLPNAETLLSPGARAADLSKFVHHQTGDKYDVLRSNPTMLATEQRIAAEDFDRLHAVVTKYFRLILIDSGNDESAERWLRMIDHTDQLVIATTALGEHAEAGALLLEALAQRDEHSAKLAAGAVVIVSQSEKSSSLAAARGVADGFGSLARIAVSVPFDRAMHGGKLRYDDLAPATRRAWLRAAAAVAEGL
jgi:MinD-like ATPase involved in chromosome partitioning or flagellar assembly